MKSKNVNKINWCINGRAAQTCAVMPWNEYEKLLENKIDSVTNLDLSEEENALLNK